MEFHTISLPPNYSEADRQAKENAHKLLRELREMYEAQVMPIYDALKAIDDRDIALAHLTIADAETAEDVVILRSHWEKHMDEMAASKHSGDCTKEPWTCSRCLADEAYKMATVYRKLFGLRK